jgi:hypothetical protein
MIDVDVKYMLLFVYVSTFSVYVYLTLHYALLHYYVRLNKLIREGSKNPAVVRVTLLNTGVDAYKHGEYGDRITVERKIRYLGYYYNYNVTTIATI